jgi:hypothetical protein
MKKIVLVLGLVLALGLLLAPMEAMAQTGPGRSGPQGGYENWNYCPYCGSPLGPGPGYGMGPGMMGPGYGYGPGMMPGGRGMGPGMMGPGYGYGPGMMGPGYGYGPQYQAPQKPLEEKDAKEIVENYVRSTRNPNLKAGKIIDKDTYFEAEILTKDGSLADKLAVDKRTGWMRSIY